MRSIIGIGWLAALLAASAAYAGDAAPIATGAQDVTVGGQPAARLGDTAGATTEDGPAPLVSGSPDVFIGGKPAATTGDATACGGTIVTGAPDVFVNGKPLARMGDAALACPEQ